MPFNVGSRIEMLINPSRASGSMRSTTLNTYLLSWIIIAVIMPLLLVFFVVSPQLRYLIIVAGSVLLVIALTLVLLARTGHQAWAGLVLTLIGWGMLTWITWVTGGLYSPSLCAQFILVVLAEMCSGWRTALFTVTLSTLTIIGLGSAQAAGIVPPSLVAFSPALYATVVAVYLIALSGLEGVLLARMSIMQSHLGTQLDERRAAEKRLRDVIDNAPFGAFVCEQVGGELLVTQANRSASLVLGTDASRFLDSPIETALPAAGDDGLTARLHDVAENGGTHDTAAVPFLSAGERRVLDVHAFQIEPGSLAVFFSDVTEKQAAELEIHRMAFHDELTELPNRKLLHDRLASALSAAQDCSSHVAVLFIDLDNFKSVNDEFGHGFGDKLLVAVAHRLRGCARSTDTVARVGGDEFTIIVPDIELREQAERVARQVVESLRDPFVIDGHTVRATASVGVSMTTELDRRLSTLLEQSDIAMYRAKRAGRDGYQVYQPGVA